MIPLRDDIGEGGASPLALLICLLIFVAGVVPPGGDVWVALLCAFGAWIFAPTPVRELGPIPVALIAAAGGLAGGLIAHAAGSQVSAWGAVGATASVALLHIARHPKARALCLVAVPYRAGFAETPTPFVAIGWGAVTALVAVVA